MAQAKRGAPREGAPLQNFEPEGSDTTSKIAPSTKIARPQYVITFAPGPGVDAVRSLRWLLKTAKRRFGLVATDAFEDRGSALPISNQAADEFQELRDEVVAERAHAWRRP